MIGKKIAAGLLGSAALAAAEPLELGAALPELTGKNQDGELVEIAPAEGDHYLFLFSYPKASTPG